MKFFIYRLREDSEAEEGLFFNSQGLKKLGLWPVKSENYKMIYTGISDALDKIAAIDALDKIYYRFNNNRPSGFGEHHSVSTGDIIVLDGKGAWFCEHIGWTEIPDFYAAIQEASV